MDALAVGRQIREIREARTLSLRALAEASGVSRSMLSDIERGAKSPTIALLAAISEGLDVPLSALVGGGGSRSSISVQVVRAADQRTISDPSGVRRTTLGMLHDDSSVEFVRFELPPRTVSGTFAPHKPGTLERIYIERGTLDVHFGDEQVRLQAGDTLSYEAAVPHSFANVSGKIAVLYLVIERR
ncbi:MAG: helix-turn-helix protein [Candidatus Eremiobacteraeota bacterium]|nr:helix-turn-helix protein [Candidatus Eremiobacteraeota bacterium]